MIMIMMTMMTMMMMFKMLIIFADEDLLQELKSLDSVLGEGQPLFRVLPPSQHDDDRDHDGADDDDDEKSQCPMAQMMGNDSMMMIRIIML